jgi:hypothetical protein
MRKLVVLILAGVIGLCAKLWVNSIRDPGAELGQGDWETDIWESPEGYGVADSMRVDAHDSSRAYEGDYSFLTDTDKDPGINGGHCVVWCYQPLRVPKAIPDIDTCYWAVYVTESGTLQMLTFDIAFVAQSGKKLSWFSGSGGEIHNDTLHSVRFPLPEGKKWTVWGGNLSRTWIDMADWFPYDTIVEVQLCSKGQYISYWRGQDVSWDKIFLRSVAYYDYAAKSIDSDELAGKKYTPAATFANEGIKDDSSGMVYAEILEGEAVVYKDSQEVSILHESSEQVGFREWTVPHGGSYTLRVYPILALDEYSADDTLEITLTGVSIDESPYALAPILEIKGSTIHYALPQNHEGSLTLYDASGRRVERRMVKGSGSLEFGSALPAGAYIVRLETGGLTATRKAVILLR